MSCLSPPGKGVAERRAIAASSRCATGSPSHAATRALRFRVGDAEDRAVGTDRARQVHDRRHADVDRAVPHVERREQPLGVTARILDAVDCEIGKRVDGQPRCGRGGPVVGEHRGARHRRGDRFVVPAGVSSPRWREHQEGVGAGRDGIAAERARGAGAGGTGTGDDGDRRRDRGLHGADQRDPLVAIERRGFSGRTRDHDPGDARLDETLRVLRRRRGVDLARVVEEGEQRDGDTPKRHGTSHGATLQPRGDSTRSRPAREPSPTLRAVLFPTVTFAIFFAIVLPLSWLLMPSATRWRLFMIGASYFFYGYWNPRFVLLIVASTIWNQAWGTAIHRAQGDGIRRFALGAAVAGDLGLLGYFKYAQFFEVSARNVLTHMGLHVSPEVLRVTLPVGISFFTFQAMSYVIDIYRRQIEPVGFLDFAVYVSFFPHLVAGPIVRASEFLPQLREKRDARRVDASRGFFLIVSGLFKKVVLANFLATTLVDHVFSAPELHNGKEMLFAIYGYAVQIYCDFSGYTDIAIGLALLLGFRFPQNFDAPYTAVSIQDFWRRWHMTLSRWLRDYLYIPLGGNRGSERATYRNLMITMLLGGLWHGAAWTFVVWGGLHGAALTFEHWRAHLREVRGLGPPPDTLGRRIGRRVVTFHIVCLAWVFFRAETFHVAWVVLTRLFVGWSQPAPLLTGGVMLAIAFGVAMQYVPRNAIDRAQIVFSRLSPVQMGLAMGVALLIIDALGPQGVAPFIYFAF